MYKSNQKEFISLICDRAIAKHPVFWASKRDKLNNLISNILDEIIVFEEMSSIPLSFSKKKAKNILAVWCVSGSGSLTENFIDSPSDNKYKNKDWYAGSDRIRLRYCESIILAIAKVKSGQKKELSFAEEIELAREYGPHMIYNGIQKQVLTLLEESRKTFAVPKEKIYIPKGKIANTLDQIKKFSMPAYISEKKGQLIVISHSPHLSRILRFMKKYEHKFKGLTIGVIPIPVGNSTGFIEAELSGILDYIAMGESAYDPITYSIN